MLRNGTSLVPQTTNHEEDDALTDKKRNTGFNGIAVYI